MPYTMITATLPDGSITQIKTTNHFTHAVATFNIFFDGWMIRRWEDSEEDAKDTIEKDKKAFKENFIPEHYAIVKGNWYQKVLVENTK